MKKQKQLGMHPSTAAHRLRIDILFDFVKKSGHTCYRCGKELTRETFSIEHKEPWLDSESPRDNFFNLSNIAFSHGDCNRAAARSTKGETKYPELIGKDRIPSKIAADKRRKYSKKKRREQYLRTGK